MKKFILLLTITSALFSSCKKDNNPSLPFTGHTYAPDNIGHEVIYDVDSIIKSDFTGLTDTFHFQVKELIESYFINNSGDSVMRLERYKRLTPSDPWIIYKVWTAKLINVRYEKMEDNITYVKLVFTPQLNKTWDGNVLNNLGQQDYTYTSVNDPDVYNGLSFDSTLTVSQNDYEDFIEKKYEIEKYATGVGAYYKEQQVIEYDYIADTIKSARIYIERIVSFNN